MMQKTRPSQFFVRRRPPAAHWGQRISLPTWSADLAGPTPGARRGERRRRKSRINHACYKIWGGGNVAPVPEFLPNSSPVPEFLKFGRNAKLRECLIGTFESGQRQPERVV